MNAEEVLRRLAEAATPGYEVLEQGEVPAAPGVRYRVRVRRPAADGYWERLRAATRPPPRVASSQLLPAPQPLPEVLAWAATRLDQEDADAVGP